MSYLVLARKWRPQNFDELVGQEPIARILKNAITQNKVAHAYIFSGPRGVGKTSTARILAKALNCQQGPTPDPCGTCTFCKEITEGSSMDVSEIDGASNTGVDNVRDLRERVRYAAASGRYKIYIIDEAHMLSTAAFNALLKTLEEPPPHVIFVLATTDPKRIPSTVLSRCQHLPFRRIAGPKIRERLNHILKVEGLRGSDSALDMIARAADGSMRDALTILDQVTSFSDEINASDVQDLLAITDIMTLSRMVSAVIEGDNKSIIAAISDLTNSGTDLRALTKDLLQFMRNLLIVKITGGADTADVSDEEASVISHIKEKTSEEHLALLLSEMIKAEPAIRNAYYPRVALEMTLIRLALLSRFSAIDETLAQFKGAALPRQTEKGQTGETKRTLRPKGRSEGARVETPGGLSPVRPGENRAASDTALHEVWGAALTRLEETNRPLACKLREGTAFFGDDEIRIVFSGGLSVHAESVKESLPVIKEVIGVLSGRTPAIILETAKTKTATKKELKQQALDNPLIKEALELFEGRIVDVLPINHKGGENV